MGWLLVILILMVSCSKLDDIKTDIGAIRKQVALTTIKITADKIGPRHEH